MALLQPLLKRRLRRKLSLLNGSVVVPARVMCDPPLKRSARLRFRRSV